MPLANCITMGCFSGCKDKPKCWHTRCEMKQSLAPESTSARKDLPCTSTGTYIRQVGVGVIGSSKSGSQAGRRGYRRVLIKITWLLFTFGASRLSATWFLIGALARNLRRPFTSGSHSGAGTVTLILHGASTDVCASSGTRLRLNVVAGSARGSPTDNLGGDMSCQRQGPTGGGGSAQGGITSSPTLVMAAKSGMLPLKAAGSPTDVVVRLCSRE